MEMLSELENTKLSKVMTHELVAQVTKSMNMVNFADFESKIKLMMLDILKQPINKMALQEELITKYGEAVRRNVRRVHEMEYVIQKYSKVCD